MWKWALNKVVVILGDDRKNMRGADKAFTGAARAESLQGSLKPA